MTLEARRDLEPAAFGREARPFLLDDEALHGLLLAMLDGVERGRWPGAERTLVRDRDTIVGLALRTPPQDLVLAQPRGADPRRVTTAIADAYIAERADVARNDVPDVPALAGVFAPEDAAATFAAHWGDATGSEARVLRRMRIHRLDRVEDVPLAEGAMRPAEEADRELLVAWSVAFHAEALEGEAPHDADAVVGRMLNDRVLQVWQVAGEPVSMAAAVGPTPTGIRVNHVYTPPEQRGRGYATSLVASLSREQLRAGRRFCTLYTDLANPTSNAIYRRIGYRGIGDQTHLRFVDAPA